MSLPELSPLNYSVPIAKLQRNRSISKKEKKFQRLSLYTT